MAVVNFEKNGQGFFDFDALLNATSEMFVEQVKACIKTNEKLKHKDYSVKVDIMESVTAVYVFEYSRFGGMVSVFNYFNDSQSIYVMYLSERELEMMLGELNGKK